MTHETHSPGTGGSASPSTAEHGAPRRGTGLNGHGSAQTQTAAQAPQEIPQYQRVTLAVTQTLQNPQTPFEERFEAYKAFKALDLATVPADFVAQVPELDVQFQEALVVPLYRDAQRVNIPGTDNPLGVRNIFFDTFVKRYAPLFAEVGITPGKIYEHAAHLVVRGNGELQNSFVRGLVTGNFAPQNAQVAAASVDDIVGFAAKAQSLGGFSPRQPVQAYYTTALTYSLHALNTYLSSRDEMIFSNEGLQHYPLFRTSLERIVNANDTLGVDVPARFSFAVKEEGKEAPTPHHFDINALFTSVEGLEAIYEQRKADFTRKAEEEENKKSLRAQYFLKHAIEKYNANPKNKKKISATANLQEVFETSKEFRAVVQQEALESIKDALGFIQAYSTILDNDPATINGFIRDVVTQYKDETGQEHPFIVEQMRQQEVRQAAAQQADFADYMRSIDDVVGVPGKVPPRPLSPKPRPQNGISRFFSKFPRWMYGVAVAAAVAGVGYAKFSDTVQRTPGYLVADVNNDGKRDLIEVTVKEFEPFALSYKVLLGKEEASLAGQVPSYVSTTSGGKDVASYKARIFKVIDTEKPQGNVQSTYSYDGCADIAVNSPTGTLVIYQGDCKGSFKLKAVK